jgi:hypothetical protein
MNPLLSITGTAQLYLGWLCSLVLHTVHSMEILGFVLSSGLLRQRCIYYRLCRFALLLACSLLCLVKYACLGSSTNCRASKNARCFVGILGAHVAVVVITAVFVPESFAKDSPCWPLASLQIALNSALALPVLLCSR